MSGAGADREDGRGKAAAPSKPAEAAGGQSGIPKTGRVLGIWTIVSLIGGAIGAQIGVVLGAPYYFGFFVTLVVFGLAGLFAVAAHVDRYQNRR